MILFSILFYFLAIGFAVFVIIYIGRKVGNWLDKKLDLFEKYIRGK